MHISNNPQLMRAIIMDHYQNPRNKQTPSNLQDYRSIHMNSTACVDDIWVYLKIENNIVTDAKWDGVACTISTASTSIMSELLLGKNEKQALHIIDQYMKMIDGQPFDEELLDEAVVFVNTARQPARIKCATLGWLGSKSLIEGEDGEHKHD